MNIDLTPILQALIGLLAMLITYRLIPWLKAKTDAEQREKLAAAIRVSVFAAEQIFGAGHGAKKMDYALKYLHDNGFDIDGREVEAAVCQYFNIDDFVSHLIREPKPPAPDKEDEQGEE